MFSGCSYPAFGSCVGGTGPEMLLEWGLSSVARFKIRTLLCPADFESVEGNTEPRLHSAGLQDMRFENYCSACSHY